MKKFKVINYLQLTGDVYESIEHHDPANPTIPEIWKVMKN